MTTPANLDSLCINTIRFLSVDAIQKANSGHPGLPMGAAPMAYALWTRFLRHNPRNPHWDNRDRFVLSGGHGSMLLYSLLFLTGYEDISLDEIKNFRQWGSRTPGHPENTAARGVETTTGPLGQGFGNGMGMAIAEAYLGARYNRPGFDIVDHYTYGIVSDGDLMEGVASECASLAGHLKLGKLIYLYDDNKISLGGATGLTFTEDVQKRFDAYGWHTQVVADGNDVESIAPALKNAREENTRPSLILIRTHIGYGAPHKQDTFEVHGTPLGPDEVRAAKENLGWPVEPPFLIPAEALEHFRQAVDNGASLEKAWREKFDAYARVFPDLAAEYQRVMRGELPPDWDAQIPMFPPDKPITTRVAGGQVMNAIAPKLPTLIGGSADLNPSTMTALKGAGDFQSPQTDPADKQGAVGGGWGYTGRNLCFGVREHAMGAIANGLALHGGILPYTATFLVFSDYMRPTIRLAAMSHLHVFFIFTHDSVGLGEDGPTHQPVEQIAALRAIPNLIDLRPADANETAEAWRVAVEIRDQPVFFALSRQNLPVFDRSALAPASGLRRGAYVLADAGGKTPDVILIASGSEVQLALDARKILSGQGIAARVVSMPSWRLFEKQSQEYRDSVLPPNVTARLAIEAGSPLGWDRWVGPKGATITIDRFGASAPFKVIFEKFGFTPENIAARAMELIGTQTHAKGAGQVHTDEHR